MRKNLPNCQITCTECISEYYLYFYGFHHTLQISQKFLFVCMLFILAREDHITEAVLFWNARKVDGLPVSLCNRLTKVKCVATYVATGIS